MPMKRIHRPIQVLMVLLLSASIVPFPASGQDRLKLSTIVIDPGHGGHDSGCISKDKKTYEKNLTLDISKRLSRKIAESCPGVKAVLTRSDDRFVTLSGRADIANNMNADLFISIHADAATSSAAHGSSVFVLSEKGASSATARTLANRENASDLIGGINIKHQDSQVASVLVDMSVSGQIKQSMKLANHVLKEMGKINSLHKSYVEQAAFAVLKAPDIPSILVETAFISNPEEEVKLKSESHQEAVANAIMNGIKAYFVQNPPHAR